MNLCEKLGGIGCIIHMGTRKTKKININVDQCIKNYIKSLTTVFKKINVDFCWDIYFFIEYFF